MRLKHLISPLDLTVDAVDDIIDLGLKIMENPEKYAHICEGKKLATLFYEPSTRTRLSFEAAMLNLGGQVLGFSSADSSSAAKGESVADTIRVISSYADICAMRHPKEGAPMVASLYSSIPIINAGDGGHNHPTQTLTDLITIKKLMGRLNDITIGMCGDLKFGRTVHSLINALVRYKQIRFVLISPKELMIPDYLRKDVLEAGNIRHIETDDFEEDYIRLKDSFILDAAKMQLAKEDMFVMHPLPRVNEIASEVDNDPRAVYFQQAKMGVYVRMALIMHLLALDTIPIS